MVRAADAAGLSFPLSAKPNWGSHGDGFRGPIENGEDLSCAADAFFARGEAPFVVEEFHEGREFRIFRSTSGGFAALERIPARVVADGASTVRALAERENLRRAEAKEAGGASLCPLAMDAAAERTLASKGWGWEDVPPAGREIRLSTASNLAKGGLSKDATEKTHGDWRLLGDRVLDVFKGLPFVGFDVLAPSLSLPPSATRFVVLEANSNPGFAMHMRPHSGTPRDVASFAADSLFPNLRRA